MLHLAGGVRRKRGAAQSPRSKNQASELKSSHAHIRHSPCFAQFPNWRRIIRSQAVDHLQTFGFALSLPLSPPCPLPLVSVLLPGLLLFEFDGLTESELCVVVAAM
jgi:hypothetical protein